MSGYLRYRADRWRPVHYRATWTAEDPAPEWWAAMDLAWMIDVGEVESVRANAARWGWRRTRAAALMAECVAEQIAWEQRPDRKAAAQARADKSRTRAAKSRKKSADTGAKDSGTLGDAERTNGGQFPDNTRTDPGHLARADFNSQLQPHLHPQPHGENTHTVAPATEPPATAEGAPLPASREEPSVPTREDPDRVVNAEAGTPPPPVAPLPAERADTHADALAAGGASRKGKAPKAKPPTDTPFRRRVSDAFGEAFTEVFGTRYPWVFKGYPGDAQRVTVWIDAAKIREATPDEGLARLHGAAIAYCRAVKAGAVWPHDEPASTTRFTKDLARWLQTNPAAPPKVNGKAHPKPSPLAVFMEWNNADRVFDEGRDGPDAGEPLPERAGDAGGSSILPALVGGRAR